MPNTKKIIQLYILCTIAFILSLLFHPYPGSFILKAIPGLLLAYLVSKSLKTTAGKSIVVGLVFSVAGDVFLDIDRQAYFVFGLGSFLVAHICYTFAFWKEARFSKERLPYAVLIVVYTLIMLSQILPNLGSLTIPVSAYIFFITLMGISAAFLERPLNSVYVGAVIFIISDSVIALNKFLIPIPASGLWIMVTYFLAQYKIATGMVGDLTIESEPETAPE